MTCTFEAFALRAVPDSVSDPEADAPMLQVTLPDAGLLCTYFEVKYIVM